MNRSVKTPQDVLNSVAKQAHYLATQMIYQANHRPDKEKGDPKIGGHCATCASSIHIMAALHLVVKTGFDYVANKPHASPTDHAYNYLLDLFLKPDLSRLSLEEANTAMMGLRKFPQKGEPVFQSYHSVYDSDHSNFLPSGTVGIPPVNIGYLALAYRFAKNHGYKVPEAHFWAVCGDSEFREGSMYEAVPDLAERELGNLTWILDYNRQSLDGHRITNKEIMEGTDDVRIERTMRANGWDVIQVRHGSKRLELFERPGGNLFKSFLEKELEDYELQSLLLVHDMPSLKKGIITKHPQLKKFLDSSISDEELYLALRDLGGHDINLLAEAMKTSKQNPQKPTMIIAHTIKGWGLKMAAAGGNHSALPTQEEMQELQKKQNIKEGTLFARFETGPEAAFLKKRGELLYNQIKEQEQLKHQNQEFFSKKLMEYGPIPDSLDINTKMTSYPHTQWMLGQLTAKLIRLANTPFQESDVSQSQRKLTNNEKQWKVPGELLVTMAPDVGTSTNLNPAMDGKIFGAPVVEDFESDLGVKDTKLPDLVPGEEISDRYLRFEISEGNVMSCLGSFGCLRDILGIPLLPLMTVYDFFIKRALDQLFYNLYWKSSFILVGTPSGITLSPEGAQHGWKSDIQIPNQITWEPFFCQELDWILSDAIRRHVTNDNSGRTGVIVRCVTRGIEQKNLMVYLKRQRRFKEDSSVENLCRHEFPLPGAMDESSLPGKDDSSVLKVLQTDVLNGAYYLIDYRGYAGYEPGDNVVHIFSMGSPTTEAIKASEDLLQRGIYANVIVVTNSDLLLGNLAHENGYQWLKEGLGINSHLHLHPKKELLDHDLVTLAGRRVPVVSIHDGEPGLLDNIGSIIGVRQESLAVRKHSRCGRPHEIYAYHGIDSISLVEAVGKALAETALEEISVSRGALSRLLSSDQNSSSLEKWNALWPNRP